VLEPFQLPFVQRGLVEVLILAVPAGLLGTWIVLRGLAFFSHAVGTAAFPGLVLADGLGFAAPLGAFGAAIAFTAGIGVLRGRRNAEDAVVALVLAGCLAGGVILASDVFGSGSNVETLLFGSLLLVDGGDQALAAGAAAATLLASALIGQHWLRTGFDPTLAGPAGPRRDWGNRRMRSGERRTKRSKDAGRPNSSAIRPTEDAAPRSVRRRQARAGVAPIPPNRARRRGTRSAAGPASPPGAVTPPR
jgi:hypothetical protein